MDSGNAIAQRDWRRSLYNTSPFQKGAEKGMQYLQGNTTSGGTRSSSVRENDSMQIVLPEVAMTFEYHPTGVQTSTAAELLRGLFVI